MSKELHLKAIITGIDKLSPVIKAANKHLGVMQRGLANFGRGALPMGAALAAGMGLATKSFMDAEDAAKQLQNTMMLKGGNVPKAFEKIEAIATRLGATLPGSTADFEKMASNLRALGLSDKAILGGALEATAKLGVVGKALGETYESAAEGVAKFSNSMGIAEKDLVPFADTVQRALHLGVKIPDMEYALARVAGPMKAMGQSGLQAANDVVPLIALLEQAGIHGEEAGTGIKKAIEVFAAHKKFTTIEAMVKDLEKLYALYGKDTFAVFTKEFGAEHAAKIVQIAMGGYDKKRHEMEAEASLNDRVGNTLDALSSKMENLGGNVENLGASIGRIWSPEMKGASDVLANYVVHVDEWVKAHPRMVKTISAVAGSLIGIKLAALAASYGVMALRLAFMSIPLGLFVTALAAAAAYAITNWDKVAPYFETFCKIIKQDIEDFKHDWQGMTETLAAWAAYAVSIWDKVAPYFERFFGIIKQDIEDFKHDWQGMTETLAAWAAYAISIWGKVAPYFERFFGIIKKDIEDFKQDWQGMTETLAAWAAFVVSIWDKVAAYFENLWEKIKKGWDALGQDWNDTINGLSKTWEDTRDAIFSVWDALVQKWNAIKNFFSFEHLLGFAESAANGLSGFFGGEPGTSAGNPGESGASKALPANIDAIAEQAAKANGIDSALVKAVIAAESGGNPFSLSPAGAAGLMQLMPDTAKRFGVSNRYDALQNALGGSAYLAFLLKRYGGDETKAIAAYNAGEGNVDKYGGIPPFKETQDFTAKVLKNLRQQRMSGSLDININGAPAGTRVEPKGGKALSLNTRVGYRSLGREALA
jgi:phage regulator Rha-like protein